MSVNTPDKLLTVPTVEELIIAIVSVATYIIYILFT